MTNPVFLANVSRLEAIARDAELVDKSIADLKRLGELIHSSCVTAVQEHEEELKEKPVEGTVVLLFFPILKVNKQITHQMCISLVQPKVLANGEELISKSLAYKSMRSPSSNMKKSLSRCTKWCPLTLQRETSKRPKVFALFLHISIGLSMLLINDSQWLPPRRFKLTCRVKMAHFDVDWDLQDDVHLLLGVYEHGFGNWDLIKTDPDLKLADKANILVLGVSGEENIEISVFLTFMRLRTDPTRRSEQEASIKAASGKS